MQKEIYENGVLIGVEEVEEAPKFPDWRNFNASFIIDLDYNKIIESANQRAVSRLEMMSINQNDNLELFENIWKAIVATTTYKLSGEAIKKWNEYAINNNMPFEFNEKGFLTVKETE